MRRDGYYGAVIKLEHVVIENAPCLLRLLLLEDKLVVSIVAAPKLETLGFIGDDEHYCGSTLVFGSTVIQVCI